MSSVVNKIFRTHGYPPIVRASNSNKTLFQHLNLLKDNGVGSKVTITKWLDKGFNESYYLVTKVNLRTDLQHGKAWGIKYWQGRPETGKVQEIRGGLKFNWKPWPVRS
ncbi:hypothetical protein K7432_017566 [Basidiobolus ranarum]|uniref:Uncharacterized protein n=1 Tax=Basidiobolus ranarum TaxID=34480 RepID=A0ABR2WD82_9FUNG